MIRKNSGQVSNFLIKLSAISLDALAIHSSVISLSVRAGVGENDSDFTGSNVWSVSISSESSLGFSVLSFIK